MKVPSNAVGVVVRRGLAALAAGAMLLAALPSWAGDKQPQPWVKIPLEKIGYPGVAPNLLLAGASVLTVNILDGSHLLVTFGKRGLVPRTPGDPETDEDRLVQAEIVAVPSGEVLATTEWHLHDHARYLWPLGQGRFLVRVGNSLSTITPLARIKTKDPFVRVAFPYRGLIPDAVFRSVDGRMVTIEAAMPKARTGPATWADGMSGQAETLLDFFRLKAGGGEDDGVEVTATRAVKAPRPMILPLSNQGYLWAREDERVSSRWALSFRGFNGKSVDLGAVDSSCTPRLELVSASEFLALTCRGSDDQLKLASYGFDAHENWEEPFNSTSGLAFAYAPAAGRFAMSRMMVGSAEPGSQLPVGEVLHQELRVYQTESGDLLLKVACTPLFKTAENFDLAEDGRTVAVVRDHAIVLYQLPAPTKKDEKDMEEVAKSTPPWTDEAPINFAGVATPPPKPGEIPPGTVPVAVAPVTGAAGGATTMESESVAGGAPAGVNAAAQAGEKPAQAAQAAGDAVPGQRKRPSLLLPGEQAEFKDKKTPAEQAPAQPQ